MRKDTVWKGAEILDCDRTVRAGLYALLIGTPLLPPEYVPKAVFLQIVLTAVLIVQIPKIIRRRGFLPIGGNVDLFLIGFVLWDALSTAFVSDNRPRSAAALSLLVLQIVLLYSTRNSVRSDRQRSHLMLAIIGTGCLCAAYGLVQYYGFDPLHRPNTFGTRVLGTFANPNHLSSYLAVCLVLYLFRFLAADRPSPLNYPALLILYTGILITETRGVFVGLGLSLAFVGRELVRKDRDLLSRRWRRMALLTISGAILTISYSMPSPLNRGSRLSDRALSSVEILRASTTKDPGVSHRWFIWSVTWEMIRAHPIAGVGYGTYSSAYPRYRDLFLRRTDRSDRFSQKIREDRPQYAHNEYLHLLAETGPIGVLLFLAVVVLLLLGRSDPSFQEQREISIGIPAALLCILVHALVSYPLHMPATSLLFWTMLGFLSNALSTPLCPGARPGGSSAGS